MQLIESVTFSSYRQKFITRKGESTPAFCFASGRNSRCDGGFTLLELMVVIIIVGVIAAFAIPSYSKSIQKAHERDMFTQLTSIHAANLLYRSYDGKYWNTGGVGKNMAEINSALSINIIANSGTVYNYNSANGTSYTATATWAAATLKVTEAAIDATSIPPNPCCQTAPCLSVPSC